MSTPTIVFNPFTNNFDFVGQGGGGGTGILTITGDNGGPVGANGGNNIFIDGGESIVNNPNGIEIDGTPVSNLQVVTLTNRINVTATTNDDEGQTQTVVLMTPVNATALSFKAIISGYDSDNNLAIGGEQIGLCRTISDTASIVGTNDTFDEYDDALSTSDWNVVEDGSNLAMSFTGVAGHTIEWRALFEYTQTP